MGEYRNREERTGKLQGGTASRAERGKGGLTRSLEETGGAQNAEEQKGKKPLRGLKRKKTTRCWRVLHRERQGRTERNRERERNRETERERERSNGRGQKREDEKGSVATTANGRRSTLLPPDEMATRVGRFLKSSKEKNNDNGADRAS